MLLLLFQAYAADDLRARCTQGEAKACDALAVQIGSRVVEDGRQGITAHLVQVFALLTTDASRWPELAARPDRPRCKFEICLPPDRPTTPNLVGPSIEWPELDDWAVASDGTYIELRVPRLEDTSLSLIAGPRRLIVGDLDSTLPHAFCTSRLTTSSPPTVVGVVGPRCTELLHLTLQGEVLERVPLSSPGQNVVSDGSTHFVRGRDGLLVEVGGDTIGELPGVMIGVVDRWPVFSMEGKTTWPDGSQREECAYRGDWWCRSNSAWQPMRPNGSGPFQLTSPPPPPPTRAHRGPRDVWLSALDERPIVLEAPPTWAALERASFPPTHRVWTGRVGPEPVGPLVVTAPQLQVVEGRPIVLPAGPLHLGVTTRTDSPRAERDDPMCRWEGRVAPCGALPLTGTFRVEPAQGGFELTRMVVPDIETVPRMLSQRIEGVAAGGWVPEGQRLTVRAEDWCGQAVGRAERQRIELREWCGSSPLELHHVVDEGGEPVLLPDSSTSPDGALWAPRDATLASYGVRDGDEIQIRGLWSLPPAPAQPPMDGARALQGRWSDVDGNVTVTGSDVVIGELRLQVVRSLPGLVLAAPKSDPDSDQAHLLLPWGQEEMLVMTSQGHTRKLSSASTLGQGLRP